jgi:hypothetical protein
VNENAARYTGDMKIVFEEEGADARKDFRRELEN